MSAHLSNNKNSEVEEVIKTVTTTTIHILFQGDEK